MRWLTLLFFLTAPLPAAERWESQYFHDVDGEEMRFSSIGFCSESRGVVVGGLMKKNSFKPIAMVTSTGGKTWTQMPMEELGRGVFFLDETSGWMLTDSGIWFTDECGRSWRRIHKQRDLTEVRFISRERGWAVGANKTAIETFDGGKTWSKVKAASELDTTAERTVFTVVAPLAPNVVLMVARSAAPRFFRMPVWLDPHPQRRRELPAITATMETRDGGVTWKSSKTSMFGRVTAVRTSASGLGLLLVEFEEYFDFPSELYSINANASETRLLLRRKDFAITDMLASSDFYIAGFQPPGALFRTPIPGKIKIMRSKDLKTWTDQSVDYRAVGTRVMLAESGGRQWAATDAGMILSLIRE
jgi:hypothetical protein